MKISHAGNTHFSDRIRSLRVVADNSFISPVRQCLAHTGKAAGTPALGALRRGQSRGANMPLC